MGLGEGVKMAKKDLRVMACGGDGEGYGIGMGDSIDGVRGNMNMRYIVMENEIHGLSKGER